MLKRVTGLIAPHVHPQTIARGRRKNERISRKAGSIQNPQMRKVGRMITDLSCCRIQNDGLNSKERNGS